jgi:peptidoglycan/LPS O-acetylase OafA/YrhL
MDLLPTLLLDVGGHALEVAETLIGVGRILVIFVAARFMAELMVRLQLPTILGELVAGVLIGASGLHLVVPPETQAQLSASVLGLIGSLADVPPEGVAAVYAETFPTLQAVAEIGLFALLFLTGRLHRRGAALRPRHRRPLLPLPCAVPAGRVRRRCHDGHLDRHHGQRVR